MWVVAFFTRYFSDPSILDFDISYIPTFSNFPTSFLHKNAVSYATESCNLLILNLLSFM